MGQGHMYDDHPISSPSNASSNLNDVEGKYTDLNSFKHWEDCFQRSSFLTYRLFQNG